MAKYFKKGAQLERMADGLTRQLQRQGYGRLKDVAYASVDEKGKLAVVGAMQGAPARVRP